MSRMLFFAPGCRVYGLCQDWAVGDGTSGVIIGVLSRLQLFLPLFPRRWVCQQCVMRREWRWWFMLSQEKHRGLPMGRRTPVSHRGAASVYSEGLLTRAALRGPACEGVWWKKKEGRKEGEIKIGPLTGEWEDRNATFLPPCIYF